MKNLAVYSITNTVDGRAYIGSSRRVVRRFSTHKSLLNKGCHHSPYLQNAWNAYGAGAFVFEVIECVLDETALLEREQFWIDRTIASSGGSYNICPVAGTREGVPQPESVATKLREVHKGKPKSAEHRAKIGAANKGKVRSEEAKAKCREATIKQFSDPEARKAASERQMGRPSAFKGRKHSAESIANMRAGNQARHAGKPKTPRRSYYKPVPEDLRRKTGPAPGTPRIEKRRFSDKEVIDIRSLKSSGMTYKDLSYLMETDNATLFAIVHRKTYQSVV